MILSPKKILWMLLLPSTLLLSACADDDVVTLSTPKTPQCVAPNIMNNGQCVPLEITDVSPLFVSANTPTTFDIVGVNLPKELQPNLEQCHSSQVVHTPDKISYTCTPSVGEHLLTLSLNNKNLIQQKIVVGQASNEKINLPPPPSQPDNTVQGVDSNKNQVRDDVEIALTNYVTDPTLYKKSLVSAKAYQDMIDAPVPTTREQAIDLISDFYCDVEKGLPLEDGIYEALTYNTKERQDKYTQNLSQISGGLVGSELKKCQ